MRVASRLVLLFFIGTVSALGFQNCAPVKFAVDEQASIVMDSQIYVCQGIVPTSSSLCPDDEVALTSNANRHLVNTCTNTAKCEYTCSSGYQNVNGSCQPLVCQGTFPANANLCAGDDTGLSANTNRVVVNSCTNGAKCEYTCATGYQNVGGTCQPIVYVCQGMIPANANLCSGDDTGLSSNANRAVVNSCTTGAKCEYTCATGYQNVGGVCQPLVCQGTTPANANLCAGDDTGLITNTSRSLVNSCTDISKCEYTCATGYQAVGGVCQAITYACQGVVPTNANICTGDDTGLSTNANRTVVNACTAGVKCEYTCATGYQNVGGVCQPFTCQGAAPTNANLCAGDDMGLMTDTNRTVVNACTAGVKCEYTCATGYQNIAGVCQPIVYVCQGTVPAYANLCTGDDTGLTADTARSVVNSCTAGVKCEYTCAAGYQNVGGVCQAIVYACLGTAPANANLCTGDDSGLTVDTNRTVVNSCTTNAKCEYTCALNYQNIGGVCTACQGTPILTQTLSCPSGQIGTVTQTRTVVSATCPLSGPYVYTYSDWVTTANSCAIPPSVNDQMEIIGWFAYTPGDDQIQKLRTGAGGCPTDTVDNGDAAEFCYEPSGVHGFYFPANQTDQGVNTLRDYILNKAGAIGARKTAILDDLFKGTNPFTGYPYTVSHNVCLMEGLFYYMMAYVYVPPSENMNSTWNNLQFSVDGLDDGLRIIMNQNVLVNYTIHGTKPIVSMNLGLSGNMQAMKTGANTLFAIWNDDCSNSRGIMGAKFLYKGAVKTPLLPNVVRGYIYSLNNAIGISNVRVSIAGQQVQTDASGFYQLENIPDGTYTITATHPDGRVVTGQVTVSISSAQTAVVVWTKGI